MASRCTYRLFRERERESVGRGHLVWTTVDVLELMWRVLEPRALARVF